MIEKLPEPLGTAAPDRVVRKLNELIEAVNKIEHPCKDGIHQWVNGACRFCGNKMPDTHWSGEPVVKSDVPSVLSRIDGMLFEQSPPLLQETGQQEKEGYRPLSLQEAIAEYGYRVTRSERSDHAFERQRWAAAAQTAKANILAAAQREYGKGEKHQPPTILTDDFTANLSSVTVEKRGGKFYYPGTDREYPGDNRGL